MAPLRPFWVAQFHRFLHSHGLHLEDEFFGEFQHINLKYAYLIDQAIAFLSMNNWDVQKATLLYATTNRKCNGLFEGIVWREEAQAYVTTAQKWDDNCYDPYTEQIDKYERKNRDRNVTDDYRM